MMFKKSQTLGVALFGLITMLVYLAYAPGFTGSLFYDDFSNLNKLPQLHDLASMRDFVMSGNAGPFGRPLALASFLPHANDWPNNLPYVFRTNVFIHIINGWLLFLVSLMFLRLYYCKQDSTHYWIALGAATLWLVLPLSASTSLIAVQRMTSLACMFGLIGLAGFVFGYFLQERQPKKAFLLQISSLGCGTLLAMLSKENGALFPIYALVIDRILITGRNGSNWLLLSRQSLLWLALLTILFYLSPFYRNWFSIDSAFSWSAFDRIVTQIPLLWHYLYLAFLPSPTDFAPFHDDIVIVTSWFLPSLGLLGFALLIIIGYIIRHRTPWLLFAVLWFLTGHLLESSVLNLELMFEHRNYLAVFGFCLAVSVAAWHLPGHLSKIGPIFFLVYLFIQSAILYGTTSIWGNQIEAAETWVIQNPNSPRAILHLSDKYYNITGNPGKSLQMLDQTMSACTRCTDVRMQALLYSCNYENSNITHQRFQDVLRSAQDGRTSVALLDSFYFFHEMRDDSCPPLEHSDIFRIVVAVMNNPQFKATKYQVHAMFHAAFLSEKIGNDEAAVNYLERATQLAPNVMPILQMQVRILNKLGRHTVASEAIEQRRTLTERNDTMSDSDLDALADMLDFDAAK